MTEHPAHPAAPLPDPAPDRPRRAERGELVSALSALVLLVVMFATAWFGVDQLPGRTSGFQRVTAENGWNGLTVLRWLMLLTILTAIGALVLHATQRSHGATNDTGGLVAGLGTITAVLLIYRVLINLPSPDRVVDQKFGALLGVLSALGIAFGGHASMRAQRARSRLGSVSRSEETGVAAGAPAR